MMTEIFSMLQSSTQLQAAGQYTATAENSALTLGMFDAFMAEYTSQQEQTQTQTQTQTQDKAPQEIPLKTTARFTGLFLPEQKKPEEIKAVEVLPKENTDFSHDANILKSLFSDTRRTVPAVKKTVESVNDFDEGVFSDEAEIIEPGQEYTAKESEIPEADKMPDAVNTKQTDDAEVPVKNQRVLDVPADVHENVDANVTQEIKEPSKPEIIVDTKTASTEKKVNAENGANIAENESGNFTQEIKTPSKPEIIFDAKTASTEKKVNAENGANIAENESDNFTQEIKTPSKPEIIVDTKTASTEKKVKAENGENLAENESDNFTQEIKTPSKPEIIVDTKTASTEKIFTAVSENNDEDFYRVDAENVVNKTERDERPQTVPAKIRDDKDSETEQKFSEGAAISFAAGQAVPIETHEAQKSQGTTKNSEPLKSVAPEKTQSLSNAKTQAVSRGRAQAVSTQPRNDTVNFETEAETETEAIHTLPRQNENINEEADDTKTPQPSSKKESSENPSAKISQPSTPKISKNETRRTESYSDFQSFFDGTARARRTTTASRASAQPLSLRTGTYEANNVQQQGRTIRNGIVNTVRFIRADGVRKANIIVDPPALGRISVELTSGTSGVEASVKVASEQIRQIVQDQITQLRDNLLQQGVQVAEFTVDVQQDNSRNGQGSGGQNQRSMYDFTGTENDEETEDFRIDLEEGLLYWVA